MDIKGSLFLANVTESEFLNKPVLKVKAIERNNQPGEEEKNTAGVIFLKNTLLKGRVISLTTLGLLKSRKGEVGRYPAGDLESTFK